MTESICGTFKNAFINRNGKLAAKSLTLSHPDLREFAYFTNHAHVERDVSHELFSYGSFGLSNSEQEVKSWVDVFVSYWRVACALERGEESDWTKAWEAQKEVVQAVIRGFQNAQWPNYFLPVLYMTCNNLRLLAIRADAEAARMAPGKTDQQEKLKDTATVINRGFTICISDRAPLEESRKWGTYYMATLLFKAYFKLNTINLTKNIMRAIQATATDLPSVEDFPKSQGVTWWYYLGVIEFLEAKYEEAEKYLLRAYENCHKDAKKQSELILTYLIPCRLVTRQLLPSRALLAQYSRIEALFLPFAKCIKSGDLKQFDLALQAGESEFVKRRIYLTLERAREVALRNLFRRAYMLQSTTGTAKTRVPLEFFRVAVEVASGMGPGDVEVEEVECLLANMIYKGFMKGYISREHSKMVLSNKEPFPGTTVGEES